MTLPQATCGPPTTAPQNKRLTLAALRGLIRQRGLAGKTAVLQPQNPLGGPREDCWEALGRQHGLSAGQSANRAAPGAAWPDTLQLQASGTPGRQAGECAGGPSPLPRRNPPNSPAQLWGAQRGLAAQEGHRVPPEREASRLPTQGRPPSPTATPLTAQSEGAGSFEAMGRRGGAKGTGGPGRGGLAGVPAQDGGGPRIRPPGWVLSLGPGPAVQQVQTCAAERGGWRGSLRQARSSLPHTGRVAQGRTGLGVSRTPSRASCAVQGNRPHADRAVDQAVDRASSS